MLNIKYGISGDRTTGAHSPVPVKSDDSEELLLFKISLKLKRPVLDPCLAVGFLPFSTDCLRVGQLVNMKWRVERLKDLEEASLSDVSLQNILGSFLHHFPCYRSRLNIFVTKLVFYLAGWNTLSGRR